jgi:CheY-like chemotaxis protein
MARAGWARYGSRVKNRVLIIEDDVLSATVLADGMRALDWEVEHVATGPEGLARALQWRPEAVISDLALPGLDGATITATLRMSPGPPMALMLVSAREGGRRLAAESGAHRFLEKPITAVQAHSTLLELIAGLSAEPTEPPPGAVRLPAAEVLGNDPPDAVLERGRVAPGWLASLLKRLYDRRATGVLDVDGPRGHAKVFFHRGAPAALRSSEPGTELGKILERLGFLTAELVDSAVAESRRRRRALGDQLVRSAVVDHATAERALREQILARLDALNEWSGGTWTFGAGQPLGLAGFDVPAGLAYWRLGADIKAPAAPPAAYVRVDAPAWIWPLLDDEGRHGSLRDALTGGPVTTAGVEAFGAEGARLLRVFHRFGLVSYVDEPPTSGQARAGLGALALTDLEAAFATEQRALADADHYTLLGLAPDAEASDVLVAGLAALSRYNPDSLPAGASQLTRDRARTMFSRAAEANRVLADEGRRALYDAILARKGWRTDSPSEAEGALLVAERGRSAFRRGEHVAASRLFLVALTVGGQDPDVLAMLGRARRLACPDDPLAGEAEMRSAVALAPGDEYALLALSRALAERGELVEARELLRRILADNPEFEQAREAMRLLSQ